MPRTEGGCPLLAQDSRGGRLCTLRLGLCLQGLGAVLKEDLQARAGDWLRLWPLNKSSSPPVLRMELERGGAAAEEGGGRQQQQQRRQQPEPEQQQPKPQQQHERAPAPATALSPLAGPNGGPAPAPSPAAPPPGPEAPPSLLDRLAQCCGTPEAEAAGLSPELVGSFIAAFMGLPDAQKAEAACMLQLLDRGQLGAVKSFAEGVVRRCGPG